MPKTLLAVDDSVTMRKVLEITFASDDFRVLGAENGQRALAQLSEEPVAAVIDTSLEGEDGYAIAKQIRARDPRIAIVLMASRYNPYDANRGRDAGADDFADKPFDTQGLLDKVKKAIATRESQKAAPPAPVAAPPAPAPAAPFGGLTPRPPITASIPSRGPTPIGPRAHTLSFDSGPAPQPPAPAPAARPVPPTQSAKPAVPAAQAVPAPRPPVPSSPHTVPTAAPPSASYAPTAAPPAPSPVAPSVTPVTAAAANGLAGKLDGLGLTPQQVEAVLSLSRELVERVVWEVVPLLAETMIKEEITRLTKEG